MNKPEIPVGKKLELKAVGSWPDSFHVFDQDSADAIQMAWAAERPLLVRGEPGTGKSQLARAAAKVMERAFVSAVVNARTEAQDLLWKFDAVARLGEAQALAARREDANRGGHESLDARLFLSPGPLWWAFHWASAKDVYDKSHFKEALPFTPDGWSVDKGCVVLIDEIDKADSDVPNSLLETFGNRNFSVPWLPEGVVRKGKEMPQPLIIITTNEDRELPAAFLRRCLVLNQHLGEGKELIKLLTIRGRIHFPAEECSDRVLRAAAQQLVEDRESVTHAGGKPPGQAEYLDLLLALTRLCPKDAAGQLKLLKKLSGFAYRKFRDDRHERGI